MDATQAVKYLVEHSKHMVIATAGASGKPWISPVGFTYDDAYNLYWVSYKGALHSQNIANRPEVAIVIFGPLPSGAFDGVYIDATASELKDEAELQAAIACFARRPQPDKFTTKSSADVTGEAAWRMYKAVPIKISKRSDASIGGQAITTREPIEL